jgi:hypothetical protein
MADSKAKRDSEAVHTVEETIANAPGIEPGNVAMAATVQSTTEETPAEQDKTSAPNALDAKNEDPPVRTSSPDTTIAQTLTAGAGAHTPPDPDMYDSEGRPKSVTGESVSSSDDGEGK